MFVEHCNKDNINVLYALPIFIKWKLLTNFNQRFEYRRYANQIRIWILKSEVWKFELGLTSLLNSGLFKCDRFVKLSINCIVLWPDWQWKNLYYNRRSWALCRPRHYSTSAFVCLWLLRKGNWIIYCHFPSLLLDASDSVPRQQIGYQDLLILATLNRNLELRCSV